MKLEDLPWPTRSLVMKASGIKKPKGKAKASDAQMQMAWQLRVHGMTGWNTEHRFAMEALNKGWRFDFAHLAYRVAIEVEGLRVETLDGRQICTGRHSTPAGYREDCRKYNAAAQLGWQVLRFDQVLVKSGEAIATVERVLVLKGWRREKPLEGTPARIQGARTLLTARAQS